MSCHFRIAMLLWTTLSWIFVALAMQSQSCKHFTSPQRRVSRANDRLKRSLISRCAETVTRTCPSPRCRLRQGPVTSATIKGLSDKKEIDSDAQVWRKGHERVEEPARRRLRRAGC